MDDTEGSKGRLDKQSVNRISLIIGLAIPVLVVLFIAASIYLPRWFSTVQPPTYDFDYQTGSYPSNTRYRVINQHLTTADSARTPAVDPALVTRNKTSERPRLFLHHVQQNRSEELSFDQASNLILDPSQIAPDGYRLEWGTRNDGFPFFYSRDSHARYLVKKHRAIPMNLIAPDGNYYSLHFLGWVLTSPDRHSDEPIDTAQ